MYDESSVTTSSSILGRKMRHSDYSSLSEFNTIDETDFTDVDTNFESTDDSYISDEESLISSSSNSYVKDYFKYYTQLQDGLYKCKKCDKEIKEVNVKWHRIKHEQTKFCKNCKMKYTEGGFSRHKCVTSTYCFRCKKKFSSRSKFNGHLRQHVIDDNRQTLTKRQYRRFECEICKRFLQIRQYESHMKSHSDQIQCLNCQKMMHKRYMERHLKTTCPIICQTCNITCSGNEAYEQHLKKHQDDIKCIKCDLEFPYLVHMAYHFSAKHTDIKEPYYQCYICQKKVKALAHHLRTHKDQSIECDICNKMLPNYSALKEHQRYHKILNQKGEDREIVTKTEQGINEIKKCTQCNESFKMTFQLLKHFENHLCISEIVCPICDKDDFKNFVEFNIHVFKKHIKLQSNLVKCLLCAKVVPDIYSHYRIHENPKYECELCEVTFYNFIKLRKHYNLRHGVKFNDHNSLKKLQNCHKEKFIKELNSMKKKLYLNSCERRRSLNCLFCKEKVHDARLSSWVFHMNKCPSRLNNLLRKCLVCNRTCYGGSDAIKRHIKMHQRHENYQNKFEEHTCPICPQSFLSHIRLKAHLLKYHSINHVITRTCVSCSKKKFGNT